MHLFTNSGCSIIIFNMNARIDKSQKIPLYYQLEKILLEKIESGEYKPGDKIPTEAELQKMFGVSRMTVRQAISRLVNAGKLRTEQGRGTFVTEPKISEEGKQLFGLTSEFERKGYRLQNKLIRFRTMPPPQYVSKELGLEKSDRVFYMVRLRLVNGEPIVLNKVYINPNLVPNFHPDKMVDGSFFKTVEKVYGLRIGKSKICIEAIPAQAKEAAFLKVKTGYPLLEVKRVTYTEDERPIEYSQNFFRSDKYTYKITI